MSYFCKICSINSNNKTAFEKHLLTNKHKQKSLNTNINTKTSKKINNNTDDDNDNNNENDDDIENVNDSDDNDDNDNNKKKKKIKNLIVENTMYCVYCNTKFQSCILLFKHVIILFFE